MTNARGEGPMSTSTKSRREGHAAVDELIKRFPAAEEGGVNLLMYLSAPDGSEVSINPEQVWKVVPSMQKMNVAGKFVKVDGTLKAGEFSLSIVHGGSNPQEVRGTVREVTEQINNFRKGNRDAAPS
jgi:hypothetical protein